MSNTRMAGVLTLVLGLALPAAGRELKGVNLPDSVDVGGKVLTLNGMGVRTKLIFKVYVAGLYLETASKDDAAIVSGDQVKRVHMSMLRDLDKGKLGEAIVAGFEKNSKEKMPALKERLDKLLGGLVDTKQGDQLVITYMPGRGTELAAPNGTKLLIEGKDFADAMFSVWLGPNPVDTDLKKGLLGR